MYSWEIFSGLVVFSLVSAFTPGPNNLMVMASGVNFGFARTIPHILGVGFGFIVMLGVMGLGLGQLFLHFPVTALVLKVLAGAYLLFLAWKLATSGQMGSSGPRDKPLGFFGASAFQWVNPKAWAAALTVVANFTIPSAFVLTMVIGGAVNFFLAICAVSTWTLFGTSLRRFLEVPKRLKIFNITMAVLLVLSMVPAFLPSSIL